ncbi:hypothetical protein K8I85_17570, partial [bacterium]|nr:hypothetical protein [bacterium]
MTSTTPDRAPAAPPLPPVAETVDVAVPVPVRTTFTYRVPHGMARRIRVGSRVLVPFGSRLLTGFVVGLDPPDAPDDLKAVRELVDEAPLVDAWLLDLTRWIADRTLCSWGEALKAALPGHTAPKLEKLVSLGASTAVDLFAGSAGASIDDRIVAAVGDAGDVPLRALAKTLGMRV